MPSCRITSARSPIAPSLSSSLVVPSSTTVSPKGPCQDVANSRKRSANFAFVAT